MRNEMTEGYDGHSIATFAVIAVLVSVAIYNAVELIILVFSTFTQYSGLYFWSLLFASCGIIPHGIGHLLKYYHLTPPVVGVTFIIVGWIPMVTGQAFVLWSRLHLVLHNPRTLRYLLYMILTNVVLLHIPTTVIVYCANFHPTDRMLDVYEAFEKVQLSGFCFQEFVISGFYLIEAVRMFWGRPESQGILYQLVAINVFIICLDAGLIGVEIGGFFILQTIMKGMFYSIKLKLEFAVLRNLVRICKKIDPGARLSLDPTGPNSGRISLDPSSRLPDFIDVSRIHVDVRHAPRMTRRMSRHPYLDDEEIAIRVFEHSNVQEKGEGKGDVKEAINSVASSPDSEVLKPAPTNISWPGNMVYFKG